MSGVRAHFINLCRFRQAGALALAAWLAGPPGLPAGVVRLRDGRTVEGELSFNDAGALVIKLPGRPDSTLELRDIASATFAEGSFLSSGSTLPNGWTATDLGEVRGFSRLDTNHVSLRVEGRSTNALAGHFVSRPMPSDGDIFVRVEDVAGPPEAGVGLMVRAQSSQALAALTVHVDGRLRFTRRHDQERRGARTTVGPAVALPVHLRLQKSGPEIRALYSANGKDWQELARDHIGILPQKTWRESEGDLYLLRAACGLFATSPRPGSTGTARVRLQIMTQHGLLGEYFAGRDLSNLKMARVDPQLRFHWRERAPDPAVGSNDFSVRWTGKLVSRRSATYYFYTETDDTVRLWVDGREVQPTPLHSSLRHQNAAAAQLVGGRPTDIRVEFEETDGPAEFHLLWAAYGQNPETVPMTNFLHYFVGAKSPESIAIARMTNAGPVVRGLLLRNGTFLAGSIARADESAAHLSVTGRGEIPVLNNRIARIVVRPPRQSLPYDMTRGRTGVFMRNADFLECEFRSLEHRTLTVSSVLFGLKRYSVESGDSLIVILHDVAAPASGWEVRTLDGAIFLTDALRAGPEAVRFEDSLLGSFAVPVAELVEIRPLSAAAGP